MKTIALILFLMANQTGQPVLAPDFYINENIKAELKYEILGVVKATIDSYYNDGNFWDKDLGQFDNQKYLDFIKLFGGSAEVVNDLSFSDEMLPYSEYAQLIFDNLQEIGVPFNLEEVMINRIDIDEGGYYIVDLDMTKRLYSGLNQNGKPVKLRAGRKIKLNLRIDLPSYLLTDARIQYVRKKAPIKVKDYLVKPIRFINEKFKNN